MSDTSTRPSPTENTSVEGFGLSERKKTAVQKLVSISDYNRAEKLFDALRAKNKVVTKQRRISKWAEEFYHLRCMILDSEIEVVLEWYCANIGGEFVPWAHSAKSFRDDFPRIKDQMEMQRRINPAPLEVTETAKRILTDVQDWFSGQNAVRLPQAVQKSLDGAKSFFLRLQELKATETLAKQLVERWKFYPYLVREWFQVLSDTIFKSPDTYAKITNYAFSLECTYADTFLAKIAGDTTGRPDNWNKLKERINGRA